MAKPIPKNKSGGIADMSLSLATQEDEVYPASLTKRKRRTKAEMEKICCALYETLHAFHPMTVRQVFYQLVTQGVIAKTENEYNNTVSRLLVKMRRAGDIPFSWIADNTRWMRKPRTYSSMEEALQSVASHYRRALWDNQDAYVEVWTEKDAIAGVLSEVTRMWDVPLMVSRGFSSVTFLYSAAENIEEIGKPTYIYYFGDHDPSGVRIDPKIEKGLREFAPEADIHFQRVAVTRQQIEELNLPTRPTKAGENNKHAKGFEGDSVEVDAIEPSRLQLIARECIEQHVDQHAFRVLKEAEESEREIMMRLASRELA
jgi:hypothetical protein